MGVRKKISLKVYFRYFILKSLVLVLMAIAVPTVCFSIAAGNGYVTFANESELEAKACKEILEIAPDITKVVFPLNCKYLVLDNDFNILFGNMDSDSDIASAIKVAKGENYQFNGKDGYMLAVRENEYCIIKYYIGSQFTNPWLREHMIPPEKLIYLSLAVNIILVFMIVTSHFSKKMKMYLKPIIKATQKISDKNLDFELEQSDIKEISDILDSFDIMRNNLKVSLKRQWELEERQKEQLMSITHDLKTPLTIIQGNLDLLDETSLDGEQKEYVSGALKSTDTMGYYINILNEISKAEIGYRLTIDKLDFLSFWAEIISQSKVLCAKKCIKIVEDNTNTVDYIKADRLLLIRAIMNIVSNAVDYTPENGTIYLKSKNENNDLYISIEDSGKGFSDLAMSHAKERFYMGDKSRNSREHFGMGLFIADSIVKQHNGKLILQNSDITGGAVVTIVVYN